MKSKLSMNSAASVFCLKARRLAGWTLSLLLALAGASVLQAATYENTEAWCKQKKLPTILFSFEYAKEATILSPAELGPFNYVQIELKNPQGATLETFTVGFIESADGFDEASFGYLGARVLSLFEGALQRIQITSSQVEQMGENLGYRVNWTAAVADPSTGNPTVLGRLFFLDYNGRQGLVLVNMALPGSEVRAPEDFGKRGISQTLDAKFQVQAPAAPEASP